MKDLIKKIRDNLLKEVDKAPTNTIYNPWDDYLIHDGKYIYFKDIEYKGDDPREWKALAHLHRISGKLTHIGKKALQDNALISDISAALEYWLDNDFRNVNWWYNQIGMVNVMSEITIMLKDILPENQIMRMADFVKRGSVAGAPEIMKWTGANLVWGIRNTIYYALIIDDEELIRLASDRISQEIRIAEGLEEGIKPDMSFYQHGPMLYSCGYGRSFTHDTSALISLLSGSRFAIPEEKTDLFEKFVLEGLRYMTRNNSVDYQSIGREIARSGAAGAGTIVSAVAIMLNTEEFKRKDELKELFVSLNGGEEVFTSTKYFPYSYFLSHKSPDYHISVKGYHTKYKGTEWGNYENLLGYNLNYGGVMTFMSSGKEYYNINPLWDYSAIPGTTAPIWSNEKLIEKSNGNWKSQEGTNDDCGGCTVGRRGALYMRLDHDGISGYKAYFPYEDGIVCLGCGIDGPETLYTTVDQAFRDGENFETYIVNKGESVINGGFRYINLSDAAMTAESKVVNGSWKRNNDIYSDEIVSGNIFKLTIDHSENKEYAYAVVSAKTNDNKIAEIKNAPEEQSVTFKDGMKIAVIRSNGSTDIVIE